MPTAAPSNAPTDVPSSAPTILITAEPKLVPQDCEWVKQMCTKKVKTIQNDLNTLDTKIKKLTDEVNVAEKASVSAQQRYHQTCMRKR